MCVRKHRALGTRRCVLTTDVWTGLLESLNFSHHTHVHKLAQTTVGNSRTHTMLALMRLMAVAIPVRRPDPLAMLGSLRWFFMNPTREM